MREMSLFVSLNTPPKTLKSNKERKKKKETEECKIPKAIKSYRQHMGNVDRLDQIIGYYRSDRFSKKWYSPINFYFIEAAVHNAWVIYNSLANPMGAKEFRVQLSKSLIQECSRKRNAKVDVDKTKMHLVRRSNATKHCKSCKSSTPFECSSCEVHLCTGCFYNFHCF